MKIAIPILDTENNRNTIAASLNVNGSLYLYDSETKSELWLKTLELAANMGELLPALELRTISAIITEKIHPMALKVLVNKGFEVYRSKGNELDKNIRLFNEKALNLFNMDVAMDFATVCGGECNSCETECKDEKTN